MRQLLPKDQTPSDTSYYTPLQMAAVADYLNGYIGRVQVARVFGIPDQNLNSRLMRIIRIWVRSGVLEFNDSVKSTEDLVVERAKGRLPLVVEKISG